MRRLIGMVLCLAVAAGTARAQKATLTVTNPLDRARPDAICIGPASLLGEHARPGAYTGVTETGETVAVQVDDIDGTGTPDEFVMVLDLDAGASRTIWVDLGRPWEGSSRVDVRTSWRWEGYAALETELQAFGLYGIYAPLDFPPSLQWDLYGKRPEARGLSLDALEPVDYHEDNPVAVDYLLVGQSLGLGGPILGKGRPCHGENGSYVYREICDGPVRAGLEVVVTGWSTPSGGSHHARIHYFVYAGHDFIDAGWTLMPPAGAGDNFGVGIRRIQHPEMFLSSDREGILATLGQQEGIIGLTGLAVIFEPDRFLRWGVLSDGGDSYVVYLTPEGQEDRSFYRTRLVGLWSESGIATAETSAEHLRDLAQRQHNPVTITQ